MFVGHAALAFGIAVLLADRRGWDRDRVLLLGVVAGLFAAVPDVDVLHGLVGVPALFSASPGSLPSAFWTRSNVVHRALTHSLVVAGPAALAFALWARSRSGRALAACSVVALTTVGFETAGVVGGAVMAAFGIGGVAVAAFAASRGLGWRATAAAALLGLASHPFGDVFTGRPPAFLYPFDATLLASRVGPFADPTLDLLLAFGVELAAVWLAAVAAGRLFDVRLGDLVAPRAAVGAGYAILVPVLPAPTLDVSYHFVFSILAVGSVGVAPVGLPRKVGLPRELGLPRRVRLPRGFRVPGEVRLPDPATAAVTGLAAVTLAGLAFTIVYVLG